MHSFLYRILFLLCALQPNTYYYCSALFGIPSSSAGSSSSTAGQQQQRQQQLRPVAIETSSSSSSDSRTKQVLIAVDCLCQYHGGYLTFRALDDDDLHEVVVVHVLSDYLAEYLRRTGQADEADLVARRRPRTPQEARLFVDSIVAAGGSSSGVELVGVYCESDSGLHTAEELRELLNVTCVDDPIVHTARRNKHLMYETVKNNTTHRNLCVAQHRLCRSRHEAIRFAQELLHNKNNTSNSRVVVKPFRGVASESVTLCETIDDVTAAWNTITSTQVFGSTEPHATVIVQEFLAGVEYAVDAVSRDGHHRVAAVWRYRKQPANGAAFCYYQTELVDAAMDDAVPDVCRYATRVLDALGVKWGVSHTEVIVVQEQQQQQPDNNQQHQQPVLVEVNMRQHNMDFLPLVMACIGYNVFDLLLLAMFGNDDDDDEWARIPDIPTLRTFGCMAHLVNSASGTLVANHHLEDMANLESVLDYEVYEQFRTKGQVLTPTIDIRSDAGWVQLINPDYAALQDDYQQIEEWMDTMFETSSEE